MDGRLSLEGNYESYRKGIACGPEFLAPGNLVGLLRTLSRREKRIQMVFGGVLLGGLSEHEYAVFLILSLPCI